MSWPKLAKIGLQSVKFFEINRSGVSGDGKELEMVCLWSYKNGLKNGSWGQQSLYYLPMWVPPPPSYALIIPTALPFFVGIFTGTPSPHLYTICLMTPDSHIPPTSIVHIPLIFLTRLIMLFNDAHHITPFGWYILRTCPPTHP